MCEEVEEDQPLSLAEIRKRKQKEKDEETHKDPSKLIDWID